MTGPEDARFMSAELSSESTGFRVVVDGQYVTVGWADEQVKTFALNIPALNGQLEFPAPAGDPR